MTMDGTVLFKNEREYPYRYEPKTIRLHVP